QYEENAQNSDEAENDYNYIINEKTDTEAVKRTKMSRKRKSVLLNYGKTYFYDDLNDVIFTIQQLSFEEQLVEIRKRLHTTYKDTTYKCDLCFRGFMHKYAFDRHMSLHASVSTVFFF
ncbi:jg12896, partial [Pararge aegeria aegeria]